MFKECADALLSGLGHDRHFRVWRDISTSRRRRRPGPVIIMRIGIFYFFPGEGGRIGSTRKEGTRASVAFTKIGFETLWLAPDGNWAGGPGLAIGYPSQGGETGVQCHRCELGKEVEKVVGKCEIIVEL